MSGEVQDGTLKTVDRNCSAGRSLAALLACAMLVAGCGGGFGLRKAEVDPTILTGALPVDAGAVANLQALSDQATVRNAISSANIEDIKGEPIAWAKLYEAAQAALILPK